MGSSADAFLVVRLSDGFGDVHQLHRGQTVTMGRAPNNPIVVKDELCSRNHAEVYFADRQWRVRDLESMNGTRVNGEMLESEEELRSGDVIQIGQSKFLFVHELDELPRLPAAPVRREGISIKKRLGQTRFMTPLPEESNGNEEDTVTADKIKHSLSRDLSLLYRLALDMGTVGSFTEMTPLVLTTLLEATPAEMSAVLTIKSGPKTEVVAKQPRDPSNDEYVPLAESILDDVLDSKLAVLAEDPDRERFLRNADSEPARATSLLCAPVLVNHKVEYLIQLYCTDPHKILDSEDLEFTMAVAKQLGTVVAQLRKQNSLLQQYHSLRDQLRVESELIGDSEPMREIERQIGMVAGTNATVLVRGESGSGKELVARAIHFSSNRKDGPFICLNCAALTETLLESELFGHEKGAFTGATEKKIGKFEAADGGTIFLDEIGEMSVNTQAKLLRILEGHPFERVGGGTTISVNVRVVAATNQPLEEAIHEGRFRKDLFFRLQVVEIRVPPLRDRREDVPILAEHFLKRFVNETARKISGFTSAALAKLKQYHWPGNVRELRNVVERAVALGRGHTIDASDIWLSSLETTGPAPAIVEYEPITLSETEKKHIAQTLEHTEWNKSQAAGILGIERSTLDRKIKAYELKRGK